MKEADGESEPFVFFPSLCFSDKNGGLKSRLMSVLVKKMDVFLLGGLCF